MHRRERKEQAFITGLLLVILSVPCHALTPGQVFDKVKNTVVVVKTFDAEGKLKGQGSGVLISSGRIATNCHVVEGGDSYQVSWGKQLVSATLYAKDKDKDICLLDAEGIEGKPAQLGKAANLKVGDRVYAVGAPKGLELSLSDGIVAQLRGGPPPFIQTTAAISPGSSGGGLFDGEGRLVGLTTLYLEGGQSLNFAMPVEWIGEIKPGRKRTTKSYDQDEWSEHYTALEKLKDWQGLLDWTQKWTKSEPGSALAWTRLGDTYVTLAIVQGSINHYSRAIEAFHQALQIDPEDLAAWYNIALPYRKLNRHHEAIEAYRQALRISPELAEDFGIWFNLGNAYRSLDRFNDAIESYREALRINPKFAGAHNNIGCVFRNQGKYQEAISHLNEALRINPNFADAWYNLAIAYLDSGNRTAALNAYRELRRLDPTMADELFNWIAPR